ncbi:MAG: penicillin-binding protein 2 [Deltaproteobacteria bacterium]|nr:penicillin-binding protein 2 [Deltaproteobacteria bacterium]
MRERVTAGKEVVIEGRLWLLGLLIFAVFAVFVGRLAQLQIVEGAELRMRSEQNSIRTVRLDAPRGRILDREGRVLASTRPAFDLEVMPSEVRGAERTYRAIGQLLDTDTAGLRARVDRRRGRERFQPLLVQADLPYESLARIETHRYALPGVITEVRPRREYTGGDLAAHLLGTLGEVRADQLERPEFQTYRQGEVIGQTGLEAVLESSLRGSAGGRNVIVDVAGREVERLDEVDPIPGSDVTLTIDLDLQRAAAEAFRAESPEEPDREGALVALDPRSGDVLAMVSRPAFDPNAFAGGVDAETWRSLTKDPLKPLQNRVVAGQYPPGSTYKVFLAAAGLETGLITPSSRVVCPGSFWYGNRSFKCWKKEGHGAVDLHTSLVRSCDVYYYQLGVRLGVDRIASFSKAFNLGRLTGIPLSDEKPGLVPSSEWKLRRFKTPWYPGETVSISIGQGYDLTTPLQLAVAYAAIANGGTLYEPRLVLRRRRSESGIDETKPKINGAVPVKPESLALIRKALAGVVEQPGGTGSKARVPGVPVAGKTGTAQVVRLEHFEGVKESKIPRQYRDHAWFVSFAPAEDAEIVVAVLAEHGGHGGSAAAPLAQKVLAKYFEKKGVVPPPKPIVTSNTPHEEDEDPLIEDAPEAATPDTAVGGSDAAD